MLILCGTWSLAGLDFVVLKISIEPGLFITVAYASGY